MVVCCFSGQKRHPRNAEEAKETLPVSVSVVSSSSSTSSTCTASVVIRNFNSLYDPSADSGAPTLSDYNDIGSDTSDSGAHLSVAMASRRLTRPDTTGSSSSIFSASSDTDHPAVMPVRVGAEPRCSPDPHEEFRRSMEEMVTALGLGEDHRNDQLELQQLLLCYLALNGKAAHKYIVGAFADLLRGLPPPVAADDR